MTTTGSTRTRAATSQRPPGPARLVLCECRGLAREGECCGWCGRKAKAPAPKPTPAG